MRDDSLYESLIRRGVSRRDFLKFCTTMAATLALPSSYVLQIAEALQKKQRPTLVWLDFQNCAGDIEALLKSSSPTIAELVLDILSVDYYATIMAPAGKQAEKSLADVVKNLKGKYIAIADGAIPMKDGGVYACVSGRSAIEIAKEVCGNAMATICVGTCASFGGIPAAAPNPTGAVGVREATGIKTLNLSGCPMNPENLTATIVHFLTFGTLPATDNLGRPLFAHGKRIHDNCERRSHFDAGQFVRAWGDEGHRQGWCLYEMGCKGPEAFFNCPTVKYNGHQSWPVQAGHGCVACAVPDFWDKMTPFYRRLPKVPGFGVETTADKIGAGLAVATAVGLAAHGIGRALKSKDQKENKSE